MSASSTSMNVHFFTTTKRSHQSSNCQLFTARPLIITIAGIVWLGSTRIVFGQDEYAFIGQGCARPAFQVGWFSTAKEFKARVQETDFTRRYHDISHQGGTQVGPVDDSAQCARISAFLRGGGFQIFGSACVIAPPLWAGQTPFSVGTVDLGPDVPYLERTEGRCDNPSVLVFSGQPAPTQHPSFSPMTPAPTTLPTSSVPTATPTLSTPTEQPTQSPTSSIPSTSPSIVPTVALPTKSPSEAPTTSTPTNMPTSSSPSLSPSQSPTVSSPTLFPTLNPTTPSIAPSIPPTVVPTLNPTNPTAAPSKLPTLTPTTPSVAPSLAPTEPLRAARFTFDGEISICDEDLMEVAILVKLPDTPGIADSMESATIESPQGFEGETSVIVRFFASENLAAQERAMNQFKREVTSEAPFVITYTSALNESTCNIEDTEERTFVARTITLLPGVTLTHTPTLLPTTPPTSSIPTASPSSRPTSSTPTMTPTHSPSESAPPTISSPSISPTISPTSSPTISDPTFAPSTSSPSLAPTKSPTSSPTSSHPTVSPSSNPSLQPTTSPSSSEPTSSPTTAEPTNAPTGSPSCPTVDILGQESCSVLDEEECCCQSGSCTIFRFQCAATCCQFACTDSPTVSPTVTPTLHPSASPSTAAPTLSPSSNSPTSVPTTGIPTSSPTASPTLSPSDNPSSSAPTAYPSTSPTMSLAPSTVQSFPALILTYSGDLTGGTDEGYAVMRDTVIDELNLRTSSLGFVVVITNDTVELRFIIVTPGNFIVVVTFLPSSGLGGGAATSRFAVVIDNDPFDLFGVWFPFFSESFFFSYVSISTDSQTLSPTNVPSLTPTEAPSTSIPTFAPTKRPTIEPTRSPTLAPSFSRPTQSPSFSRPTQSPTFIPTFQPSLFPTESSPTSIPTDHPTKSMPTSAPTLSHPTASPSCPDLDPSVFIEPSFCETISIDRAACCFLSQTIRAQCYISCCGVHCDGQRYLTTPAPSSSQPTSSPSWSPTSTPTQAEPSTAPTYGPSNLPTRAPTRSPTSIPTWFPTVSPPTQSPSSSPSSSTPTSRPTESPSILPTYSEPTTAPSLGPTELPSFFPSRFPSISPTIAPTLLPTSVPSSSTPTISPTTLTPTTGVPVTSKPSLNPSNVPTNLPTKTPSKFPTISHPSSSPITSIPTTSQPSESPLSSSPSTSLPSSLPTRHPSSAPVSSFPTRSPQSSYPTIAPSKIPSFQPTRIPSIAPTVRYCNGLQDAPHCFSANCDDASSIVACPANCRTCSCNGRLDPNFCEPLVCATRPDLCPGLCNVCPATTRAPQTSAPTAAPTIGSCNSVLQPDICDSVQCTGAFLYICPIKCNTCTCHGRLDPEYCEPRYCLNPASAALCPAMCGVCPNTTQPTLSPTLKPTEGPTISPTVLPSYYPTVGPSLLPSKNPTISPSRSPSTPQPSHSPTLRPTELCSNETNALSNCVNLDLKHCLQSQEARQLCGFQCCTFGFVGQTEIVHKRTIVKGRYKHVNTEVDIFYTSPYQYDGLVDIIIVVQFSGGGPSRWSLESPTERTGLPSTGIKALELRALSTANPGNYTIRAVLTPSGQRWAGRFRTVNQVAGQFELVEEYVEFSSADAAGAFLNCPFDGCDPLVPCTTLTNAPNCWNRVVLALNYASYQEVEFSVKIKCIDPSASSDCKQYLGNFIYVFDSVDVRPSTLGATNNISISFALDPFVNQGLGYTIQIEMTTSDAAAGIEVRDRTTEKTLLFVATGAAQDEIPGAIGGDMGSFDKSATHVSGDRNQKSRNIHWVFMAIAILTLSMALAAYVRYRRTQSTASIAIEPCRI